MAELKVYAVNSKSVSKDSELGQLSGILEAIEPGSLVCLPEYFLDGENRYEGICRGDTFQGVLDIASQKGVYLAFGMVEKTDAGKYITTYLTNPNGDLLGRQQKNHPTSFERKSGVLPGAGLREIIKTDFGTVGFTICFDQWPKPLPYGGPDFSVGPEIVIHPRGFGLNDEKYGLFYDNWLMLDRTTAMLRKAYLVGVTGDYGDDPLADIIDFEGGVLAESNVSGAISAVLDLDKLRDYRNGRVPSRTVPRF